MNILIKNDASKNTSTYTTAQKMKFFIKDFFSNCDQSST